jgi:hypothetical protein
MPRSRMTFESVLRRYTLMSPNRGPSAAENYLLRTLQVGYTEMQNDHRNAK